MVKVEPGGEKTRGGNSLEDFFLPVGKDFHEVVALGLQDTLTRGEYGLAGLGKGLTGELGKLVFELLDVIVRHASNVAEFSDLINTEAFPEFCR